MTKARDLANSADVFDTVSTTELGYLDGVSSAIQTQIDGKQAVVSGVDNTEIGYLDGVTSAIQTQINGKQAVVSGVSDTEIGYLDGVTSAIQTQLDAKVAVSTVDAKGDLLAGSADNTLSRLAVGANNTVLTADSSTSTGLKWAAAASGGMTLLATLAPTTGTTIQFSSISASYKHLLLVIEEMRTAVHSTFHMRLNSSASSIYMFSNSVVSNNAFVGSQGYAQNHIKLGDIYCQGNSSEALKGAIWFWNYAGTNNKSFSADLISRNSTGYVQQAVCTGSFLSSSAINAISFYDPGTVNFATGTVLKLYGVE